MLEENNLSVPTFSLVNCIASQDGDALMALLAEEGYHVIPLHGESVVDRASLFAQAKQDFPSVEGLSPHNWDALADYLWNGLYDLNTDTVALVWTDAHQIVDRDLQDFLTAVITLTHLSRELAASAGGFNRSLTLLLFFVGDGVSFRPLSALYT